MLEHEKSKFLQLLAETSEMYGKTLSGGLVEMYWEDLKKFTFFQIESALKNYRQQSGKAGQFMPKSHDLVNMLKVPVGASQYACMVKMNGFPCGQPMFINMGTNGRDLFACQNCYEHGRQKNDVELMMEAEIKKYKEMAKFADRTPGELAREMLSLPIWIIPETKNQPVKIEKFLGAM